MKASVEWLKDFKQKDDYLGEVPTTKKVYLYEDDKVFNSAEECAKYLGVLSKSSIYKVCNYASVKELTGNCKSERALSVKGRHVFWLCDYEKMTKDEIKNIINRKDKRLKA